MNAAAQEGRNRPYIDDKLFHFGFQLGVNFASFGVTDSQLPVIMDKKNHPDQLDTLHVRVSGVTPGFHVGFVSDLRLCKYINLRFCPGLQFSSRTLTYKANNPNHPVHSQDYVIGSNSRSGYDNQMHVLAMPVYLPLYLKFSAEREANYRPYVIAGGGVSLNVSRDREKPVMLNLMDYFCEVGFGVDLYFQWFKWCPEITYRIGFADQLVNKEKHPNLQEEYEFYTTSISRLTSHCICLTFNFE